MRVKVQDLEKELTEISDFLKKDKQEEAYEKIKSFHLNLEALFSHPDQITALEFDKLNLLNAQLENLCHELEDSRLAIKKQLGSMTVNQNKLDIYKKFK